MKTKQRAVAIGSTLLCSLLAFGGGSELRAQGISHAAATRISPDGRWTVEVADWRRLQVFELWATPTAGGARRQIGRTLPSLEDVRTDFIFCPDSSCVVYVQGETASGMHFRLYSTPIDRLAGHVISQPTPQLAVGFGYPLLSACAESVKFSSDPVTDETYAWYVVPMTGGEVRLWDDCTLFRDGFEGGSLEAWR